MIKIINEHTKKYPAMTTQDKAKLIYQNEFGCGHFIKDQEASLKLIKEEYKNSTKTETVFENIGNGYVRLYLSALNDDNFDAEIINKIFILSANENNGTMEGLIKKLSVLEEDEYIINYKKDGCPMVSHSGDYRNTYKPAYRVIKKEYADAYFLCIKIKEILKNKSIVISIDGRAAAGKTTASTVLKEVFGANIIHADDFFLPFEMRSESRMNEAGGNIHYERLKSEVADKIKDEKITYGKFDCSVGKVTKSLTIKKTPLTVIEGAYSSHPYLGDIYDLKVFFDIDSETQKERILKRNGEEMLKRFIETWIPMENRYIEEFKIKDSADIVIST